MRRRNTCRANLSQHPLHFSNDRPPATSSAPGDLFYLRRRPCAEEDRGGRGGDVNGSSFFFFLWSTRWQTTAIATFSRTWERHHSKGCGGRGRRLITASSFRRQECIADAVAECCQHPGRSRSETEWFALFPPWLRIRLNTKEVVPARKGSRNGSKKPRAVGSGLVRVLSVFFGGVNGVGG